MRQTIKLLLPVAVVAAIGWCQSTGQGRGESSAASTTPQQPILVIAEHRAARLDALRELQPMLQQRLGVQLRIVEYPAPPQDYFTKLVTELRAGNAPDVFSIPRDLQVDDLAAAGYLADLTNDLQAWPGYAQLPELVKQLGRASFNEQSYVVPSIVAVEQLYYRHDLLTQAGISTAQPKDWQDLLDRSRQIKQQLGQFPLLIPAGLTWGMGSYTEGFRYLLASFSGYQLLTADNRYALRDPVVAKAFNFYHTLVSEQLMPVAPLLNPEPWVIPKYEMFPKGQLLITTCGSWCKTFDWGPGSRNPIANVDDAVRTWRFPSADGAEPFALASVVYAWAVNAKSRQPKLATELALLMGDNDVAMAYAKRLGNVPARLDAAQHPKFAELGPMTADHALLPEARALRSTVGANAMMAGVARATEAVLIGKVDGAGAQQLLLQYVSHVLGEDTVGQRMKEQVEPVASALAQANTNELQLEAQ
jgi:multiple sugar transport system substrate-binding protein